MVLGLTHAQVQCMYATCIRLAPGKTCTFPAFGSSNLIQSSNSDSLPPRCRKNNNNKPQFHGIVPQLG